mmetsp:Transcript_5516/g.15131  ORF Transcript_5516/g.15131 Transcript_5516/m.15131 type:complete len:206 (-) Transcript_5516:250-867(-)
MMTTLRACCRLLQFRHADTAQTLSSQASGCGRALALCSGTGLSSRQFPPMRRAQVIVTVVERQRLKLAALRPRRLSLHCPVLRPRPRAAVPHTREGAVDSQYRSPGSPSEDQVSLADRSRDALQHSVVSVPAATAVVNGKSTPHCHHPISNRSISNRMGSLQRIGGPEAKGCFRMKRVRSSAAPKKYRNRDSLQGRLDCGTAIAS